MERKLQIILVSAFVLLLGFLLYAAYPTLAGTTVQLQLRPVDPTDIFRGEYLILRYDLSRFQDFPMDRSFSSGETVYVELGEGDVKHAVGYSHTAPDGLFIKGTVQGNSIIYGIEEFFIPEGAGRQVSFWNGEYTAEVKIDSGGNARVTAILKDSKPVEFTYQKKS